MFQCEVAKVFEQCDNKSKSTDCEMKLFKIANFSKKKKKQLFLGFKWKNQRRL